MLVAKLRLAALIQEARAEGVSERVLRALQYTHSELPAGPDACAHAAGCFERAMTDALKLALRIEHDMSFYARAVAILRGEDPAAEN